mmetsp:Transcript_115433/g.216157  ORF Transcript_115433/g.216157 Transcript_115433/m.216157 type:complete len:349 (-) Transcript_115433:240-1286(-)
MTGSKTSPSGKPAAKGEASTAVAGRSSRNCLHKQLRKTKFCMFHLQGACQFGKDCAFAHSVTEMNGTPDLRKTQLCKAFAEGKCEDPQCNFAHGETELRSTDMFFKKSLCIWNEKGKCRNGSQCRFAHGLTELRLHIGKEAAHAAETAAQNKGGRRRKGKANSEKTSSTGSGSSSENTHISSSNSPRSGSSSDNFSHQSAAEPMKVQPQAVSPQEPSRGMSDQLMDQQQQLQELQRQWQDTLVHRLGALEGAMEAARWQQQLSSLGTNGYNPDLRADLEHLRKGIGMLAAQCNQIQERMQTTAAKMPTPSLPAPYMANMLPNPSVGRPYPSPDSLQLWQMQMQMQAGP